MYADIYYSLSFKTSYILILYSVLHIDICCNNTSIRKHIYINCVVMNTTFNFNYYRYKAEVGCVYKYCSNPIIKLQIGLLSYIIIQKKTLCFTLNVGFYEPILL